NNERNSAKCCPFPTKRPIDETREHNDSRAGQSCGMTLISSTEADLSRRAPNAVEKLTNAVGKRTLPESYGLDTMFAPTSVAVIGATSRPGTVGRTVLENLLRGSSQRKVC